MRPVPPIQRRPRCRIHIHRGTAGADDIPPDSENLPAEQRRDPFGTSLTFIDITSQVLRVRTVHSKGLPAGTFEISLTFRALDIGKRRSLNRLLVPDNVVVIEFDAGTGEAPGDGFQVDLVGFISRVAERTTLDGAGRPHREIIVGGQDAGKFLARHQLPGQFLTAYLWGDQEALHRERNGLFMAGAPGNLLEHAFTFIFRELVPAPKALAQGGIDLTIDPRLKDQTFAMVSAEGVWLRHGPVWNILKGLADQPWTELFTDYTDLAALSPGMGYSGKPRFTLVARPYPFDKDDWDALRTTVIYDSEIRLAEIALGDDDRVNLAIVAPNGNVHVTSDQMLDGIAFQTTQFDKDSSSRHGTQPGPYSGVQTMYSDIAGTAHMDPEQQTEAAQGRGLMWNALHERANKLWRWYSINHLLYQGVWVVAGNPAIRIGERVMNQPGPSASFDPTESVRRVFYVEKIVHDFAEDSPPHFLTHLALTRGQPLDASGTPIFITAKDPDPLTERANGDAPLTGIFG